MKRTRAAAKIQQQNTIENNKNDETTPKIDQTTSMVILNERQKLNFKSLQNQNSKNASDTSNPYITASSKKSKNNRKEPDVESSIKEEKLKPNTSPSKGKLRAVVDLQMMKKELSQLEDLPKTPLEKELSSSRLQYKFYDIPCEELAQQLLGKVLVRYLENGTILKGRIVETEAYLGTIDKASHTCQNKVTPRNLPMYMPPGTIYVYMTYGMYYCFNISSQGDGCAVLVRAVDPLEGTTYMANQRNMKRKIERNLKPHELCNGPSKFCMAYQINKEHSRYSLCTWKGLWIEDDGAAGDFKIVKSTRIGIDSCGLEWASKLLRYYVYGNKSVSKKDKKAEMEIS
ncbi:DNA-3-methyladenine glycosylase isoform X1 [Camponotus floridanus]|uniref:DNA-3-methyladenine glycosylase isoform X1 n=1 Tax=Camponotus floridanus TaxID=104421 RepID=UPI00059C0F03|nr:DNA-3-methyladenine glycosylase isoform X1 [Camponotus floridanus]